MAKEEKNEIGDKLFIEACKDYGIDPKYVIGKRYDDATGEVVIVTIGGSKVRWKQGAKVNALDEIAITGMNQKAAKRKVIAGKAKE